MILSSQKVVLRTLEQPSVPLTLMVRSVVHGSLSLHVNGLLEHCIPGGQSWNTN